MKKTNSVTFQQFHCLTLDVANAAAGAGSGSTTSIDACLSNYFAEEVRITLCIWMSFGKNPHSVLRLFR